MVWCVYVVCASVYECEHNAAHDRMLGSNSAEAERVVV